MSAPAHIARENGKKGGRPKGSKSPVTLKVEAAKAELIRAYMENIRPINEALMRKAKKGDIQAIRELHDRVYGRSLQPTEMSLKGNVNITFDSAFTQQTTPHSN